MKSVIFVVLGDADRRRLEQERYEREIARCVAEVAALEAEYARVSAERKSRFQQRLEGTRKELRDTETRLKAEINALQQERDARMISLRDQLANAQAEARAGIEQRCLEVQTYYSRRIGKLTQVWELTKAAIIG